MTPIKITGANVNFVPPAGWRDTATETCVDLYARVDGENFSSAWRPSASELLALNAGGAVVVSVRGERLLMSLSVEAAEDPRLGVWMDSETAPRDGTRILALLDLNDGTYEHIVVWWIGGPDYPWASENNQHSEYRIAYWTPLTPAPVFLDDPFEVHGCAICHAEHDAPWQARACCAATDEAEARWQEVQGAMDRDLAAQSARLASGREMSGDMDIA